MGKKTNNGAIKTKGRPDFKTGGGRKGTPKI
jgi:hypothetical protein